MENGGKFLQCETTRKCIADEVDAVERFRRVGAIAARCSRRLFEESELFVVPESVGAHSCSAAQSACAKGLSRVLDGGHTLSINPGTHSRVKRIFLENCGGSG
jgi:hypothetical protein